jgi:type II secretory pathway pseudopilin PulG
MARHSHRGITIIEVIVIFLCFIFLVGLLAPSLTRISQSKENWVHTADTGRGVIRKSDFLCVKNKKKAANNGSQSDDQTPTTSPLSENTTYFVLSAQRKPTGMEYTLRTKPGETITITKSELHGFSENFELVIFNVPIEPRKNWGPKEEVYTKMYKEFWGEEVGK